MKKHLYIVDMFRDVIQKVNEAFAGKFSDWTNINNLPIIDGMYRICYLNKSYQIISGLQVKDGDIIESGNHEELLKEGKFYADLYNSQFEKVS